jgi:hypothetical protein
VEGVVLGGGGCTLARIRLDEVERVLADKAIVLRALFYANRSTSRLYWR